MRTVTIESMSVAGLRCLTVTPESNQTDAPVLVFLHGMREAGRSPNDVPKVCIHQSPPWLAMTGRIPEALVIAPQAPPEPDEDTWNWRSHARNIGQFLRETFTGRRLVATGFSRGGLGVLQILVEHADVVDRWAIVDPQPPKDQQEASAILAAASSGRGWVRYGAYRNRSAAWTGFATALEAIVPEANRDVCVSVSHGDMALRAYAGDPLSSAPKQNLYDFLDLRF